MVQTNSPTNERKQLTDIQKGEIIALSHHFKPLRIGKELNVPRQTVRRFLKRYPERDSAENLPHSSRPRKLSDTGTRWLAREALSETSVPLQELKSMCTLQQRLREKGIQRWRAVKQAF